MKRGFIYALILVIGLLVTAVPAKADFNILELIQNTLRQISETSKKVLAAKIEVEKKITEVKQAMNTSLSFINSVVGCINVITDKNTGKMSGCVNLVGAPSLSVPKDFLKGIEGKLSGANIGKFVGNITNFATSEAERKTARNRARIASQSSAGMVGWNREDDENKVGWDAVADTTGVYYHTHLPRMHEVLGGAVADLYARAFMRLKEMHEEPEIELENLVSEENGGEEEEANITEENILKTIHKLMVSSSIRVSNIKLLENYSMTIDTFQELENFENHIQKLEALQAQGGDN